MVSPDECLVLRHFKSLYSSDESSLLLSDASRSFVAIVSKNGFSVESIGKLFDPMVLVSGTQVPLTNHIIWITLHSNTQSPQFRSSQFTYISCLVCNFLFYIFFSWWYLTIHFICTNLFFIQRQSQQNGLTQILKTDVYQFLNLLSVPYHI